MPSLAAVERGVRSLCARVSRHFFNRLKEPGVRHPKIFELLGTKENHLDLWAIFVPLLKIAAHLKCLQQVVVQADAPTSSPLGQARRSDRPRS